MGTKAVIQWGLTKAVSGDQGSQSVGTKAVSGHRAATQAREGRQDSGRRLALSPDGSTSADEKRTLAGGLAGRGGGLQTGDCGGWKPLYAWPETSGGAETIMTGETNQRARDTAPRCWRQKARRLRAVVTVESPLGCVG